MDRPLDAAERIVSAQISGIAENHVRLQRCTRVEALTEMRERLDRLAPERRRLVASNAAASYVARQPGYGYDQPCAELLAAAGADLALAARVWAERFPSGAPPPDFH